MFPWSRRRWTSSHPPKLRTNHRRALSLSRRGQRPLLTNPGADSPSLSPLAVAVVSVESQLSCSATSVGVTGAAADPDAEALPLPPLDAGVAALPVASAGASDSDVLFVHCRAFFYRQKDQLFLEGGVVMAVLSLGRTLTRTACERPTVGKTLGSFVPYLRDLLQGVCYAAHVCNSG